MAARTTLAALATGSQLGALGLQPSCSWRGGWDGGASSKLRPSTPPGAALGGKLHCHLPRSTREVTAVPAVLSTVPGTHRGAQQHHPSCRGWPGLGLCHGHPVTFIVSPPWGWLCPHFLASPTPSTELDAHSCCWPSPKCGSALWVSPCPWASHPQPAHPWSTHGTGGAPSPSVDSSLHRRGLPLFGVCGRLEPGLEVICLSPAAGLSSHICEPVPFALPLKNRRSDR